MPNRASLSLKSIIFSNPRRSLLLWPICSKHTKTGIKVSVSATFELPSPFSCRSPLMQCGKLVLMVRTPLYLGVLIV